MLTIGNIVCTSTVVSVVSVIVAMITFILILLIIIDVIIVIIILLFILILILILILSISISISISIIMTMTSMFTTFGSSFRVKRIQGLRFVVRVWSVVGVSRFSPESSARLLGPSSA